MISVSVENLTKIFPPKVVALDNVSLKVKEGEFAVILGPSGSGKTTLLRIIAGLEKPTKGRVLIGDTIVADSDRGINVPPQKRDIGMVFQTWALYPNMKAFDNIAFPLEIKGLPKEELKKRVIEVAKYLEIEDLLDRYPKQMSGGQQQRVALARALVKNPKVLLLDEPFSNLDARVRVTAREFVKKIQKDLGLTTILVTHDQADAFAVGDKIIVLDKGRIQQVGDPSDLYSRPENIFIAGFIGDPPMVFNEFKIREGIVDLLGIAIKDYKENSVIVGIRPDEAIASTEQPAERDYVAILKGVVELSQYLGARQYCLVNVSGYTLRALTATAKSLPRGESVYVAIRRVHLFHPSSGTRITTIP